MTQVFLSFVCLIWAGLVPGRTEPPPVPALGPITPTSTRLQVDSGKGPLEEDPPFEIPRPAHAPPAEKTTPSSGFRVVSARHPAPASPEPIPAPADYLLPDRDEKPPIRPENSNLNLPTELEIQATDTGEKIVLPAGTYRQILQIPIDSPLAQNADRVRRNQSPDIEIPQAQSRYADPDPKAVWVRYESLEKIKIGEAERRGGIDLPSYGPKDLGPRVWYAKSETADLASSVFYFVFGGLGYSTANVLGWSAGNTRKIPGDFEYRLIRR